MFELKVAVFNLLNTVLEIYKWIVIVSALISFVNPDPYNPVVKILRNLTEPVYRRIRQLIPTVYYSIDFAPFIVVLVIYIIQRLLYIFLFS
ncbi:MAG: YggT family protein [Hydrogenothermaceae bacterium]